MTNPQRDSTDADSSRSPHDDRVAEILATLGELNEAAGEVLQERRNVGEPLTDRLSRHLGADPKLLPALTLDLSVFRVADADVALTTIVAECGGGELVGVGGGDQRWHSTLTELLTRHVYHFTPVGPVDYTAMAIGPDSERSVVAFGIWLFTYAHGGTDHPIAVLQRGPRPQYGASPRLEILAADAGAAKALVARLHELMNAHSVLRGQVVTFSSSEFEAGMSMGAQGSVTFLRRPEISADAVILPEGQLERVARHVVGIGQHRAALLSAGQHLKRGVLLYGPPGTGKTHTVRHLIGRAPDATVILLTGRSLSLVTLAAQTARALQPAIVVLEDCDLVAQERGHFESSPLLFEVLDALDGLASDSDVVFLLTTNRVDVLEPALAQRPGRVDLAMEIPKPDRAARRALVELYAGDLGFSAAALDKVATDSEGATASFVKEVVRRAVLSAAERHEPVGDADLSAACAEMMADGSTISQALHGGSPGGLEGLTPGGYV